MSVDILTVLLRVWNRSSQSEPVGVPQRLSGFERVTSLPLEKLTRKLGSVPVSLLTSKLSGSPASVAARWTAPLQSPPHPQPWPRLICFMILTTIYDIYIGT